MPKWTPPYTFDGATTRLKKQKKMSKPKRRQRIFRPFIVGTVAATGGVPNSHQTNSRLSQTRQKFVKRQPRMIHSFVPCLMQRLKLTKRLLPSVIIARPKRLVS